MAVDEAMVASPSRLDSDLPLALVGACRNRVVAVSAAATLGVVAVIAFGPHATDRDPTADVVVHLALVVTLIGAGLVLGAKASARAKTVGVVWLLSLYLFVAALLTLSGSAFGPFGWAQDQGFRTAYLTKLADQWGPVDYTYQGRPWGYPPLYYWTLARAGNLLGVPGWHMAKLGLIAVAGLVPLVTLWLWSRLVPWAMAGLIAAGALVGQNWYGPSEWLAVALLVPWAVTLWRLDRPGWWTIVGMGAVAMALATSHPYFLVPVFALFVARIAAAWVHALRPWVPPDLRAFLLVLTAGAVMSAWYWLPLAVDAIQRGVWSPENDRWYDPSLVDMPFRFLTFDVVGVLLLAGLVSLVLTRELWTSRALLALLASVYAWCALNYVVVLTGSTLQTHKADQVVQWILLAGVATGVYAIRNRLRMAAVPLATVGVAVAFVLGQRVPDTIPLLKEQRKPHYPVHTINAYDELTGGRENIVLTDADELVTFLPKTFGFNANRQTYAHPAADYADRLELIKALAKETDADVSAFVLRHNRYDRVDYLAFRDEQLKYTFIVQKFPRGVRTRTVQFQWDGIVGFTMHEIPNLIVVEPIPIRVTDLNCSQTVAALRYREHLQPDAVRRLRALCS